MILGKAKTLIGRLRLLSQIVGINLLGMTDVIKKSPCI